MTILVIGATGATGRHLVSQLLERGHHVKAVVRSAQRLPLKLRDHDALSQIEADVLALSESEMISHLRGCDAIASCLGHTLSAKGIWGQPRRLVTDAVRRWCLAIKASHTSHPIKFVLMNTTGNRNRDLNEPVSFAQRCVVSLIRLLIPPHADNEEAADYLRTKVGAKTRSIEWVVVRPDTLIDADAPSAYSVHPSPTRSAIFDAGKTSRINVANFMADLLSDPALWLKWKGQMPVIYNHESEAKS